LAAFAAHAQTFFQFQGQPGDVISNGQSGRIDSTAANPIRMVVSPGLITFNYSAPSGPTFDVSFGAINADGLLAGYTYHFDEYEAGTAPLRLDISGKSCSSYVGGSFTVRDIAHDASGAVTTLAVDFVARCGGVTPGVFGGMRYNSSIPYSQQVPSLGTATIELSSQGGDHILDGQSRSLSRDNGMITTGVGRTDSGVSVRYTSPDNRKAWTFFFDPPQSHGLDNGTYTAVIDTDDPWTYARMSVEGEGKQCASETGIFKVLDFASNEVGVITRLAVDFIQHCEGALPQLMGSIRVNSAIPYTPPTPSAEVYSLTFDSPTYPVASNSIVGVTLTFKIHGIPAPGVGVCVCSFSVTGNGGLAPLDTWTTLVTDASGQVTFHFTVSPGTTSVGAADSNHLATANATIIGDSSKPAPVFTKATSVQDMWWGGMSENGWGMSIVEHGDTLFAALYVYDFFGNPTWYVMPGGSWDATNHIYTGTLYQPTGSPFYAYDTSRFVVGDLKGTLKITFLEPNYALLDYRINGFPGHKFVEREMFGGGAATANYGDLWWGGASQNGWGVTLLQQGATLFGVWYTYDANGAPVWYVMPGGTWSASTPGKYQGTLYGTRSTSWLGLGYEASQLFASPAGPFDITFTGDGATFNYSIYGNSGTAHLVREPF
jgi:hypothetical protein